MSAEQLRFFLTAHHFRELVRQSLVLFAKLSRLPNSDVELFPFLGQAC